MFDSLASLDGQPRILIEAEMKPVAGTRIQPTGFPDLGPALYETPDGTPTLLLESAQSMANRLEAVCWDEGADDLVPQLKGLPYVKVALKGLGSGNDTTNSLLEFHRLNSPYIMSAAHSNGLLFSDLLSDELGLARAAKKKKDKPKEAPPEAEEPTAGEKDRADVAGVVNLRALARICLKYDPNSLIHGIFLEKIAGRLRHPRALSAFIEASGVDRADSGGVKFDRVLPKPDVAGVSAKTGYGNVPFSRTEFTAKSITAFLSLDLAQIRGYGLPSEATEFLIVFSLWKVRRFLDSNLRLRSACELELTDGENSIQVRRPTGFSLPSVTTVDDAVRRCISRCAELKLFADPNITQLIWNKP